MPVAIIKKSIDLQRCISVMLVAEAKLMFKRVTRSFILSFAVKYYIPCSACQSFVESSIYRSPDVIDRVLEQLCLECRLVQGFQDNLGRVEVKPSAPLVRDARKACAEEVSLYDAGRWIDRLKPDNESRHWSRIGDCDKYACAPAYIRGRRSGIGRKR